VIQVEVRLYATLRRYYPEAQSGRTIQLTLPDGTTVAQLVRILSIPPDTVKRVFVNGIICDDDHVLQDGDEAGVFPPIAGGSPVQKAQVSLRWPSG
jgi:molybdopterin converting factor small subunit